MAKWWVVDHCLRQSMTMGFQKFNTCICQSLFNKLTNECMHHHQSAWHVSRIIGNGLERNILFCCYVRCACCINVKLLLWCTCWHMCLCAFSKLSCCSLFSIHSSLTLSPFAHAMTHGSRLWIVEYFICRAAFTIWLAARKSFSFEFHCNAKANDCVFRQRQGESVWEIQHTHTLKNCIRHVILSITL